MTNMLKLLLMYLCNLVETWKSQEENIMLLKRSYSDMYCCCVFGCLSRKSSGALCGMMCFKSRTCELVAAFFIREIQKQLFL